jgi:hypothetical protein
MSEEILKDILSELKAIKEASTPAPATPAAPAPKPEGIVEEFKVFLSKYGVVGLAVAFIIGGAAGKLVSALVSDILMPIKCKQANRTKKRRNICPLLSKRRT